MWNLGTAFCGSWCCWKLFCHLIPLIGFHTRLALSRVPQTYEHRCSMIFIIPCPSALPNSHSPSDLFSPLKPAKLFPCHIEHPSTSAALPMPMVANFGRQRLEAVHFLRGQRVAHCGLKPENVVSWHRGHEQLFPSGTGGDTECNPSNCYEFIFFQHRVRNKLNISAPTTPFVSVGCNWQC